MENPYGGMPDNAAWAAASSPFFQATNRNQQMQDLQRQMDNARISGADPYRMADLNRQYGQMQGNNQTWMLQQAGGMGPAGGAGLVGGGGAAGGVDPRQTQQQQYLQRLLMSMLGMGGGMSGQGRP